MQTPVSHILPGEQRIATLHLEHQNVDNGYYEIWVRTPADKGKWAELNAKRADYYSDNSESFKLQEIILMFDPKTFSYRIVKKSKSRPTTESEFFSQHISSLPFEPQYTLGQFPPMSSLEKYRKALLGPSFDCTKATLSTEKLICGDEELSRLDAALSAYYAKLRASDIGDKREQLLTDQRNWIKQSHACKDTQCLRSAYGQRLNEICSYSNYPVKSGKRLVCNW